MGFVVTEENGAYVLREITCTKFIRMTESEGRLLWPSGYSEPPVGGQLFRLPQYVLDDASFATSPAKASSPSTGTKAEAVAQISHGVSVLNLGQSSADNTNPAAAAGSLPTSSNNK